MNNALLIAQYFKVKLTLGLYSQQYFNVVPRFFLELIQVKGPLIGASCLSPVNHSKLHKFNLWYHFLNVA